jgi:hypothetical protein
VAPAVTPPVPPEATTIGTVEGKSLAVINFELMAPPPPPEPPAFIVDTGCDPDAPPPPPPPIHTTYTNFAFVGFVQVVKPVVVNICTSLAALTAFILKIPIY